ncbi:class II glutamine amidotransferase [Gymnodinialimonas sp.]
MCRWAAYLGRAIFLEELLTAPGHSLIDQSRAATECKTAINADGFGVAWYGARPEPGLYRDVFPAWSDPNLASLARTVQSHAFLAHVRASTGAATSRNNCHPFTHGRWSFMHNGQIGGFDRFRRSADMGVSDALYGHRKGATDSELLFLYALESGLDADPLGAVIDAHHRLEQISRRNGIPPHLRSSAAWSDGQRLFALRLSSDHIAPSVFYRWSASRSGWAVVSEPLEVGQGGWSELPPGHVAVFEGDGVAVRAVVDQAALRPPMIRPP